MVREVVKLHVLAKFHRAKCSDGVTVNKQGANHRQLNRPEGEPIQLLPSKLQTYFAQNVRNIYI